MVLPRFTSRLLLVFTLVIVGVAASPFTPVAHGATNTLLAVYYGNQGWNMPQVQAMERWQGKRHAVVNLFTNWCDQQLDPLFSQQLPNIWNNGNVPMITWEPYLCDTKATPTDIEVRIAQGTYDAYINAWATRMQAWLRGPDGVYGTADDRRAYIRFAHEMNGNWYPWGAAVGNNSPQDYIAMWQHVHGIFLNRGLGAGHVQWMWVVNATDEGGVRAEQYYPGDAVVDWVAIDGYNWGHSQSWSVWQTPAEVFGPMVSRLRTIIGKPLAITEVGSTTATRGGISIATKSQWITDFFAFSLAQNAQMVAWFNEDKETDWAIFGGSSGDSTYREKPVTYKTYSAYKNSVAQSSFSGSNLTNPRLLTDAQFAGR